MPTELYYLAMIESGYSTGARSWASAVGIWQFIRGTGRRYGLKINRYVDERRDPVRSTRAAARYLGSLFRVYQRVGNLQWQLTTQVKVVFSVLSCVDTQEILGTLS